MNCVGVPWRECPQVGQLYGRYVKRGLLWSGTVGRQWKRNQTTSWPTITSGYLQMLGCLSQKNVFKVLAGASNFLQLTVRGSLTAHKTWHNQNHFVNYQYVMVDHWCFEFISPWQDYNPKSGYLNKKKKKKIKTWVSMSLCIRQWPQINIQIQ